MTRISFVEANGSTHVVDARDGQSLMEAAVANGVPGIVGDCGGCCSCATCHVHLDAQWFQRLPPPEPMELDMLEGATDTSATSRLCCQIKVGAELEGLIAHVPASQF